MFVNEDERAGGPIGVIVVVEQRGSGMQFHSTNFVERQVLHVGFAMQSGDVEAVQHFGNFRPRQLGGVFDGVNAIGLQWGSVIHPAQHGFKRLRLPWPIVGTTNHVATGDGQVISQEQGCCVARLGLGQRAIRGINTSDRRGQARRQHHHIVANTKHSTGHATRITAVVVVLGALRANHILHGEASVDAIVVAGGVNVFQVMQQCGAFKPREVGRAAHHVVALERADRQERDIAQRKSRGKLFKLVTNAMEHLG